MTELQNNRRLTVGLLMVVAIFSSLMYGWNLSRGAIGNDDEGVHALVTREIRERPDWATLHLKGVEYFRKPPLSFWVRAVTENALGESELSVRLPSAAAGVATTVLLTLWTWQWTRRRLAAAVAGGIFPLLPITFTHTFRAGETDGLLIFLLTLSAWLLWRSLGRPWLLVAAAGVVGLAVMTKSVAAGVIPIGFLLALAATRRWPYRWRHAAVAGLVFFAIAAPWHVHQLRLHGQKFWDEYVGFHIVERVEERLHVTPKRHGPFWYFQAAEGGMFPWSWLVVPAVAAAAHRIRRRESDRFVETFLVCWGVGTVALFSLAATKLAWYIAPAYPALTMLVARLVTSRVGSLPKWLWWLLAAAGAGYLFRVFSLYRTGLSQVLTLPFLDPRLATLVVVTAATVVLAALARWRRQSLPRAMAVAAAGLVVHMALVSLVVYSRNVRRSYENHFRLFRNVIEARNPTAPVAIYDIGYVTSPLSNYYLAGPGMKRLVTPLREQPDRLAEVLDQQPGSFLVYETARTLDPETADRLEIMAQYGSLTLAQVRPR